MQNGETFTNVNKKSARYEEVTNMLKLHEHLFEWTPEEFILDAGCGPGDVTANVLLPWMPTDFRLLLGVDVSPSMIKHALASYTSNKVSFATADIGGDISEIFQDEKYSIGFHKIVSLYVLHWLQDLERGLRNLYSLLRSGGQGLILFPVDRSFQRTYKRVNAKDKWRHHFQNADKKIPPFPTSEDPSQEFQEMLSSVGFEVLKCETYDQYSDFDSTDVLKNLIESLNQDSGCVPADLRENYLNDCLQEMEKMQAVKIENERVCLKQIVLLAVIRKPKH